MNQAALQQSINQQAQAQAQAQQQNQMTMNQNSMQGQQRAMGQQPGQQGFQHLQHQMQASPLPGQQLTQQMGMGMGMGMNNDSLPPNMAQNRQQQQFQMMQQAQQQQNGLNRPQNGQLEFNQADQAVIAEVANRFSLQASDQERAALLNRLSQSMTPQQLQEHKMRNQDPLIHYFRQKAIAKVRQQKEMLQAQQQQQLAHSQQGQNIPNGAPMQQQRSMNPSPLNGQAQPPMGMGGNNGFGDFMGNMDNMAAQQKQAAMAADPGQVPANGAQRISTPQPGAMSGQQMGMAMNGQSMSNQMSMAQQQAMRNNLQQQQQQQRLQAHQATMQARLNAQKMGLQGQPGGMGNGPMPPQQSPALPTLNAPLRTPSQMGHMDSPQVNPNQQFGQQLDPRFAQVNNRGLMGPGAGMNGLSPQIFASLSQEQQRKMGGLPPDKLQEVMMRLNQQRAVNAAANMQRQIPQQGNNQMQPGVQMPQANQFNQPGGQFGMPGQRPNQMNPANMTPQQQVALQEQIARIQQNPQQRQPQNIQMEQQFTRQMDAMDFPPNFREHPQFPLTAPPEVKKWGALKLWAAQNQGNLSPEIQEHIRQLMRLHWQAVMRARSQNAANQAGMQAGLQGGQAGMAGMAMSAPVAPMTQNTMQQPPNMNMAGMGQLRQITPQEIQNARQHASGKMAAATDDQIRSFLMNQQRQRQQQMLQQIQMQNQMPNMTGQQPRPGQQPPMPNNRPPAPPSAPPAQPKQMPMNNANAGNNLPNANRTARPTPNAAQNGGQNSSPAQPAKNLKRSQSDDVIEVPNPNIAQPPRQPAQQPHAAQPNQQNQHTQQTQQTQAQKSAPPQGRPNLNLTPAQVAALSPEDRKKHEMLIRVARAEQKIKAIAVDEQQKSDSTQFVPVHEDPETKANAQALLKEIIAPMMNMSKAMPRYYMMVQDENRARTFYALVSGHRVIRRDMLTPW
jgi:hypothetical protein